MSIIAEIVAKILATLLSWWSSESARRESNKAHEELGAAKAIAKGAQEAAERVELARKTEAEADAIHAKDASDTAFLQEFRRDG